jgi:hypothetical protein
MLGPLLLLIIVLSLIFGFELAITMLPWLLLGLLLVIIGSFAWAQIQYMRNN